MTSQPLSTATPPTPDSKTSARPLTPAIVGSLTLVLLGLGWSGRHDSVLSAETGLGYALGIFGVSCMILLLSYPLRKRAAFMQNWFAVKYWFRLHMMLGILGPLAILFHCNFSLGSVNSNVALFCMLLVAGSGIIGRYFYGKIHLGFYGQRATSTHLLHQARQQQAQLRHNLEPWPQAEAYLDALSQALMPSQPDQVSLGFALLAPWRRHLWQGRARQVIAQLPEDARRRLQEFSRHDLAQYLYTLNKLAQLRLFERLFSWWHVLHLPIFIMMLITAVVHVWAVHSY